MGGIEDEQGSGKGKNGLVSDTNSFLPGAFEFSCWCLEGRLTGAGLFSRVGKGTN